MEPISLILLGGILPFGSIFIEVSASVNERVGSASHACLFDKVFLYLDLSSFSLSVLK